MSTDDTQDRDAVGSTGRGIALLILLVFALGVGGGLTVARFLGDEPTAAIAEDGHEMSLFEQRRRKQQIFQVSETTRDTWQLEIAEPQIGDYTEHIALPAVVRELPTQGDRVVAARCEGIVRRWFVREGQAVRVGDPLVEIELTGESLAQTQVALLAAIQQQVIADKEVKRLTEAAQQGGIAGTKLLLQQYEVEKLAATIRLRREELGVYGLSPEQVQTIESDQRLIRAIVVRVPGPARDSDTDVPASPSDDPWVYAVEAVDVSTGESVATGQEMARLAYHGTVAVEGQAYDVDVAAVQEAVRSKSPVKLELGAVDAPIIAEAQVAYIDNRLDPQLRTHRVFVTLQNRVELDSIEADRHYRSWRFKPGQRGHMMVPTKVWKDVVILPEDAVVQDGAEQLVFLHTGRYDDEQPAHDDFRPVPVVVVHRSSQGVAVRSPLLRQGVQVAMSHAYRLLLSMKEQLSEGTGNSHAHHGHAH